MAKNMSIVAGMLILAHGLAAGSLAQGPDQCVQDRDLTRAVMSQVSSDEEPTFGDLDGDGEKEVAIIRHAERNWRLLRAGQGVEQAWKSETLDTEIQSLAFSDMDNDGDDEVIVGTKERILFYDGLPPYLVHEITVDLSEIHKIVAFGGDLAGFQNIAVCASNGRDTGVYVYDYSSSDILLSTVIGCTDLLAADFDSDNAIELLAIDGRNPRQVRNAVLSTLDLSIEWSTDEVVHQMIANKNEPRLRPKDVTCQYTPNSGSSIGPCASCSGYGCTGKNVHWWQQDCWTCTDPSYNWCNSFQSGNSCNVCWC